MCSRKFSRTIDILRQSLDRNKKCNFPNSLFLGFGDLKRKFLNFPDSGMAVLLSHNSFQLSNFNWLASSSIPITKISDNNFRKENFLWITSADFNSLVSIFPELEDPETSSFKFIHNFCICEPSKGIYILHHATPNSAFLSCNHSLSNWLCLCCNHCSCLTILMTK